MNTSIPAAKPKSHWNLPNTLTWLRILMIPGVVVLFYLPFWWAHPAAGVGFALAGITDTLDGYFARKLGLTSRLGAFLDPVADKLIVAAALVLVVSADPRWFVAIMATVIIGREIAVSALREWMAEIGARGRSVDPVVHDPIPSIGMARIAGQLEPVAARERRAAGTSRI